MGAQWSRVLMVDEEDAERGEEQTQEVRQFKLSLVAVFLFNSHVQGSDDGRENERNHGRMLSLSGNNHRGLLRPHITKWHVCYPTYNHRTSCHARRFRNWWDRKRSCRSDIRLDKTFVKSKFLGTVFEVVLKTQTNNSYIFLWTSLSAYQ